MPGPRAGPGGQMGDHRQQPKPLDRRTFLTRAAGGAAAALTVPSLLTACVGATDTSSSSSTTGTGRPAGSLRGGTILDGPASQSPVNHIVILMMENRSFDHWLGWLSTDEQWLEAGRSRYGGDFTLDGNLSQTFTGPTGPVTTSHMLDQLAGGNPWRGCTHPDPGHSWSKGRAERDTGFLSPGSGNDQFATSYYLGADLPFTSQLAKRYTTFDRSHASLLGPTYPNREYFLSGQSGGNKGNTLPDLNVGFTWPNIIDRLLAAGVSTRSYYVDVPVVALWGTRMLPHVAKVDDFFTDAAAGQLPTVSFVDPGFLTGSRTDNHPHGDIRAGETFVRDVFAAFANSPNWTDGAFILTYDEWGGFFDHVAPPLLPDDRTSTVDDNNFAQAGFRVPTVVASPFAQTGYVDHRQYDHTSILRFLEWRFLGAPPEGPGGDPGWSLTTRDRNANNIGASLVMEPDTEVGIDLTVAIAPASVECAGEPETISYAPAAGEGGVHDFETARDAGYFESVGFDTEPSSMANDWTSA